MNKLRTRMCQIQKDLMSISENIKCISNEKVQKKEKVKKVKPEHKDG